MHSVSVKRQRLVEEDEEEEVCLANFNEGTRSPTGTGAHIFGGGFCAKLFAKKYLMTIVILFMLIGILATIFSMSFLPLDTFESTHHEEKVEEEDTLVATQLNGHQNIPEVFDFDESHEYLDEANFHFQDDPPANHVPEFEFLGQKGDVASRQKDGLEIIMYYMSNASAHQLQGQENCQKFGANLVHPKNKEEFQFVENLLTIHKVPASWLLWTGGHQNETYWWWLPQGPELTDSEDFYPRALHEFTTFYPSVHKNVTGGLTMFRRDKDFGYIPRLASELHHYACQKSG